jgi:4-hydroxy-4-methyl-2-oxoglutarate aldolase
MPAELLELGAATLGESGARQLAPRLRPAWAGARVAGPALPVQCAPGDNLAVHAAVAAAAPGEVLVVDAAAVPELGYWGEVLTTGAQSRGIAGLVIDGGVRDIDALERLGFPVFSALIALPGATKTSGGAYRVAVTVGGAAVEPGDYVVADRDGVVVVPGAEIDAVVDAGRRRAAKEADMFRALRAGKTTIELLGLDVTKLDG